MFGVGRAMSPPVSLKATPVPPVTSGLAFWLDATDPSTITLNGSKVSAWADKSGNSFDFAQSNASHQPTYDATLFGGKGGVIADFATGPGMLSNAAASTITQGAFTYFYIGIRTDGILSAVLQDFGSSTIYGPAGYNNRYGIGQASVLTMYGVPVGIPSVMGLRNTGVTGTAYFFDSAAHKKPIIYNGGSLPHGAGTMGNLSFLGKDFGADTGFSSKCAAVLMYNRTLSDSEIVQVCTWIRKKYKIPMPASVNQNIVFSGDSITAGFVSDGGTGFVELAMDSLGFAADQYYMSAILGQQISNMNTTDTAIVDPLYNAAFGSKKNVIAILGGTNDIGNGATALQVESALQTYGQARQLAGWKVLVATILPTTIVGFNTIRNVVNIWIRANYHTFADGLIDIAGDATMGPDAAASDTTLYSSSDGVHPTALGHSLIAPYYAAAVSTIIT